MSRCPNLAGALAAFTAPIPGAYRIVRVPRRHGKTQSVAPLMGRFIRGLR